MVGAIFYIMLALAVALFAGCVVEMVRQLRGEDE